MGLQKLGRGNWRGISRFYVPTRTPTQVASHAQKHFMRVNGVTKRKSRFAALESSVRNWGWPYAYVLVATASSARRGSLRARNIDLLLHFVKA